jgi:hypothetical protein
MSETPEASSTWDMLRGALVTRALGIVADLDVANAIGDGPRSVAAVAAEVGADPDTLQRLLRALASDGVFAEVEPGTFRNTEASEVLRHDGWKDFAQLFGGIWFSAAGAFDAQGEPSFPRIYGTDFWSWLAAHPKERAAFDRAMAKKNDSALTRLESIDWQNETIVDVGGGSGAVLLPLVERNPGLRGIVFDRPETVRDETTFGERCVFVGGDFFERVPAGDAYLLSAILHDWDDERAAAILRTIHGAAPRGARLVLLEETIEPGNGRDAAKWLDLLMLMLSAGRERDESQWRALLDAADFSVDRFGDGIIEARCR